MDTHVKPDIRELLGGLNTEFAQAQKIGKKLVEAMDVRDRFYSDNLHLMEVMQKYEQGIDDIYHLISVKNGEKLTLEETMRVNSKEKEKIEENILALDGIIREQVIRLRKQFSNVTESYIAEIRKKLHDLTVTNSGFIKKKITYESKLEQYEKDIADLREKWSVIIEKMNSITPRYNEFLAIEQKIQATIQQLKERLELKKDRLVQILYQLQFT